MSAPVLHTSVRRDFAGRVMKFELRLGEIAELERITNTGIGEIFMRVSTLRFKHADIRETIRLGLEGAGETEAAASALIARYVDRAPIGEHLQLAADILTACVSGVLEGNADGEKEATAGPATSSPSIESPAL